MEDFQNLVDRLILPHWPFVAWMITAMVIGHVMKTGVWTKEHAIEKSAYQWFWKFMYRTQSLHPVLSGALLGLLWREPEEGMTKLPACIAYFALAGACSIFAFEVIKGFAHARGIELELPGESMLPDGPVKAVLVVETKPGSTTVKPVELDVKALPAEVKAADAVPEPTTPAVPDVTPTESEA